MENKEIIKILPKWFKERYKLELAECKEAGMYWIRAEDIFKVIDELMQKKKKKLLA